MAPASGQPESAAGGRGAGAGGGGGKGVDWGDLEEAGPWREAPEGVPGAREDAEGGAAGGGDDAPLREEVEVFLEAGEGAGALRALVTERIADVKLRVQMRKGWFASHQRLIMGSNGEAAAGATSLGVELPDDETVGSALARWLCLVRLQAFRGIVTLVVVAKRIW